MLMLFIYLHLGNGYLHHLGNWCFILTLRIIIVVVHKISFVILLTCYLYVLVIVFYIYYQISIFVQQKERGASQRIIQESSSCLPSLNTTVFVANGRVSILPLDALMPTFYKRDTY